MGVDWEGSAEQELMRGESSSEPKSGSGLGDASWSWGRTDKCKVVDRVSLRVSGDKVAEVTCALGAYKVSDEAGTSR